MKYIVIIILAGAGFYFYSNHSAANITVDSYQALLEKLKSTGVTLQEVKYGSNMLAEHFCNDETFQKEGGSSVSACHSKVNNYKEICEARIFSNEPDTYTSKDIDTVKSLSKSYINCVGIQ